MGPDMKPKIHPKYYVTNVTCGCGAAFVTRSTKKEIKLEICSACHPFYTGRQKFVDTAGRVEKFTRKYNWGTQIQETEAAAPKAADPKTADPKTAELKTADPKTGEPAAKKADDAQRETFKSLAKKQKKALVEGARRQLAERAAKKAETEEASA